MDWSGAELVAFELLWKADLGDEMRWLTLWGLCLTLIGAGSCFSMQTPPAPPGSPPTHLITQDLFSCHVVDVDGAEIGPVDGMVVDIETGTVEYIVVVLEDKFNFGKGASHEPQNRFLLVPWSYLKLDTANQRLIADMDAAHLKSVPVF